MHGRYGGRLLQIGYAFGNDCNGRCENWLFMNEFVHFSLVWNFRFRESRGGEYHYDNTMFFSLKFNFYEASIRLSADVPRIK